MIRRLSRWKRVPLLRHLARTLSALLVLVGALLGKAMYHAGQEFALAEHAHERQQYAEAIQHYERAIKWYTPLSATGAKAAERLWDIGIEAEQRGDLPLALDALRGLRGSLYAIRSLYVPYQHWIPKCEAKIARLMTQTTAADESRPSARASQEAVRFGRMFQRSTGPKTAGAVLTVLGFLGWVGGTVGFLWYGLAEPGLGGRRSLLWGGGITGCFALWIVGMLLT